MKTTTTCTKVFANLPFAHRQHKHDGHCALIHGHNWDFEITFVADRLDENLFVVDFGKLKFIREWLEDRFDHTLVLNADDPMLDHLRNSLHNLAKIVVAHNGGAEGLAAFALEGLNTLLHTRNVGQDRGLRIKSIKLYEDAKNSATVEFA